MIVPAADRCCVVLVDYQARLLPVIHGGDEVVVQACALADIAAALEVPVFGTEQHRRGLGPNVDAIRGRCGQTLSKMHFDACADGLVERLRTAAGVAPAAVVVAGCEAHVCLLQTALGLRRAGLEVFVVATACGSRSPASHALAMQRLREAGAHIVDVEMVGFEWLRSCEHPRFKQALAIIKQLPV